MTLQDFFKQHNTIALAYSGGVDSAYLLHAALASGARVKAYCVASEFQPAFELNEAAELANRLGAELEIIELGVLEDPTVASNPQNRCYYCKQRIFSTIMERAIKDGFPEVMDGTNASDDAGDRPGMRALAEMKVLSPLRICGLTKDMIRELSREAGLPTWNKPAYACLATRIPTGTPITLDRLAKVEAAEEFLMSLGYSDFRVRLVHTAAGAADGARLEIHQSQLAKFEEDKDLIIPRLAQLFDTVNPNPTPRH